MYSQNIYCARVDFEDLKISQNQIHSYLRQEFKRGLREYRWLKDSKRIKKDLKGGYKQGTLCPEKIQKHQEPQTLGNLANSLPTPEPLQHSAPRATTLQKLVLVIGTTNLEFVDSRETNKPQ